MKSSSICRLALVSLTLVQTAESFQAGFRSKQGLLQRQHAGAPLGMVGDEEKSMPLSPETSFGADAVPEGQRPVNEFLDVTNQFMFNWIDETENGNKGLLTRLVALYSVMFAAVCYPIAGATFTQEGFLAQKLTSANVGAMFVIVMVLLRIYSGWSYVGQRLKSTVIEYEETGWYDGDFERKSASEQLRDELLYEDKVEPVVERLKVYTLGAAALWVAACIGYNVALSSKPVFDEYDPAVLERLRYDEKLAGVAAQQSAGRPTYCDNRYYRAVANGGQGCN